MAPAEHLWLFIDSLIAKFKNRGDRIIINCPTGGHKMIAKFSKLSARQQAQYRKGEYTELERMCPACCQNGAQLLRSFETLEKEREKDLASRMGFIAKLKGEKKQEDERMDSAFIIPKSIGRKDSREWVGL